MREAIAVILLIALALWIMAGMATIGFMADGTCTPGAPSTDGRQYDECTQMGFDAVEAQINRIGR